MPEGPDGKTIIIVKKVSGHGGHHGGAWKVAYADFVTAMMCLFLVLWLVNSASEPTRQRVASYFRKPGVFEKGSGAPIEIGTSGILPDAFAPPAEGNAQVTVGEKIYEVNSQTGSVKDYFDPSRGKGKEPGGQQNISPKIPSSNTETEIEEIDARNLELQLEAAIEDTVASTTDLNGSERSSIGAIGNIDVKIDQRGLLIEIMDTDSASMFGVGSAIVLPLAKEQLLKIADVLKQLPNPIDIEGHTDSRPYKGLNSVSYDNWNLSLDRANAARRVLEEAGFEKNKIARVAGYADQRLKVSNNPLDPSNRRITISMRFTEQAKTMLTGTQTVETQPKVLHAVKSETPPDLIKEEKRKDVKPEIIKVTESHIDKNYKGEKQVKENNNKQAQSSSLPPSSLQVTVQTTMPEGNIVNTIEQPKEEKETIVIDENSSVIPMEEDKIFGEKKSFFQ